MITRTTPLRVRRLALLGALLAATSCASGSDTSNSTSDDGPDITLGTVPAISVPETADDEADLTDAVEPADPEDSVDVVDAVGEDTESEDIDSEATQPSLVPSPEADLPTEAPSNQTEPVPVTTLPGPLETPNVRLLDMGTFNQPVESSVRPGDQRLFIVEQGGTIVAVDDESDTIVLDLSVVDGVTFTNDGSEQGLLGLAFHPEADLAYVNFSNGSGDTVVAEFAVEAANGSFMADSYREVLVIDQPFSNHNGGELAFGPDGYLYIGTGDGGAADDPNRASLDFTSLLGKILRIDPVATDDAPFTVPGDNPFVSAEGAQPAIWSIGVRNPWRFSFDSLTGDLWIADVGQNRLEEINLAPAVNGLDAGRGLSFGWSAFEATDRFNDDQSGDGHTLPVTSYVHENGNCSVSGGVVARDSTFSAINGWYVYGDYCSGIVWALDTTSVTTTPDGPIGTPVVVQIATVPALAAVVEGPFGDIYTISNAGAVQRLAPA